MAYVLTSVSGNLISAASASFAPTNGADVSAIASAYVSGKQDTLTFAYDDDKISAINGSALAGQGGGGGLVTAIGTSESGITSINNSGLVDTAALRSADYSSLYVQEPLYISASGDSSYIGISGDVGGIDSATCSAIASAYAESAASSKQDTLSFGYDDDKISAINGSALAGGGVTGDYVEKSAMEVAIGSTNTATSTAFAQGWSNNATSRSFAQGDLNTAFIYSFAQGGLNSATSNSFAQGTRNSALSCSFAQGIYISAKDTAAVFGKNNLRGDGDTATGNSAAFAIGDGTATGARHDLMLVTKDGEITMYSSTADTVGTGIMSSIRAISAAATGGVDSATVSSIASAYVESAVSGKQDTLTFDWDADSAISSINGSALAGQGGGASITAVSYDTATQQSSIVTATGFGIVGSATNYPRISSVQLTDGQTRDIEANTLAPGAAQTASGSISYTLLFSPRSSMWTTSTVATGIFSPLQYGTGAGLFMNNNNFKGYIKGNEWFVSNIACGYARGEVHQNRGCRVIVEHTGGAGAVLVAYRRDANVTLNSTAYGTAKMAVANSQAYVQVQRGDSAFKYNSAKLDTDYLKFYNGMTTGYIDPEDTASGTAYMPAETEYMYISSIPYWNGKADSSALSSYMPYSSLEYNTASAISGINGSALAAGSTYSAGEGIDITDDVISVEAPVDIVAGPGIVIDNPDGNTLRVSVAADYEVTLFETTFANAVGGDVTLSENAANFDQLRITYILIGSSQGYAPLSTELVDVSTFSDGFSYFTLNQEYVENGGTNTAYFIIRTAAFGIEGNKLKFKNAVGTSDFGSKTALTSSTAKILKVVGIHRIANN